MMTDRELNALVAERVMGLRVDPDDCGCTDCSLTLPDYCNDIAAALPLIEKLLIGTRPVPSDDGPLRWAAAQVIRLDDSIGTWIADVWSIADTLPRAICLAAINAVGVEVE